MTYDSKTPHIRSYLGLKKIAFEIMTEYDEDQVIFEVFDHTYPKNTDPKRVMVITEISPPVSTTWMLVDEKERKILVRDRVMYKTMIVLPKKPGDDFDRVRYTYKRRHESFDVRWN